jgi:putative pyruvate formate lyase activating enzyme
MTAISSGSNHKLKLIKKAGLALKDSLGRCAICPRRCNVDRTRGFRGYCRAPERPVIYSCMAHHGEEPPISGTKGSGTIFFSHCNMKCVYCQNYYFSQLDKGEEVSTGGLADMMLSLEKSGCHNINLVSPTHFVPQILSALDIAINKGLDIPIVYNTGGYELVDTIALLNGIIDIYLPDMRYSNDAMAKKYSDADNYVEHNRASVKEMQAQVSDLALDENGIAASGLIIRLLALPEKISGTEDTLKFIKEEISPKAYLSIMSQYYPTFKAYDHAPLSRGVSVGEYNNVIDGAHDLGLNNGWIQETPNGTDPKFFGTNIKPKA